MGQAIQPPDYLNVQLAVTGRITHSLTSVVLREALQCFSYPLLCPVSLHVTGVATSLEPWPASVSEGVCVSVAGWVLERH